MERAWVRTAVAIAPLAIALALSAPWVALLTPLAIALDPTAVEPVLRLLLGPTLAPRFEVARLGGEARVVGGGRAWRFFVAQPRLSLDVHREEAVSATHELIRQLPLREGVRVLFARLGGELIVGVGTPRRAPQSLEYAVNVLRRFMHVEPAEAGLVTRLLGLPKPLYTSLPALAPFILLGLVGLALRPPAYALAYIILLVIAFSRASRTFVVASGSFPRVGVAKSSAWGMELDARGLLAFAERNVGRDFVLVVGGAWGGGEAFTQELVRELDRFAVTQRGRHAVRSEELKITHSRILRGEEPILWSALGDLVGPGIEVGLGRHPLSEPSLRGLSMDVCFLPIMHSPSLVADEAVVELGRDEYGTPVRIGLNTAPSPHALFVGPTGSGKTRTATSLLLRALPHIRGALIVDPQGEYCTYLKGRAKCVDVLDAFIDWLEPRPTPVAWADAVARAVQHAYGDPALASSAYTDLLSLYSTPYRGLKPSLQWLAEYGKATRLWSVALEALPNHVVGLDALLSEGVTVLDVSVLMAVPELLTALLELLLHRLLVESSGWGVKPRLEWLVLVDEAYLIIGSRTLELFLRQVRKRGLGLWVITQSVADLKPELTGQFGFSVLLQGSTAYAREVAQVFRLPEDSVQWLGQSLSPRVFGGEYSVGLLIYPPSTRRVYIKLERF